MIALGTHGRGRVGEALLGSVSRAVVHGTYTPVLLLRVSGQADAGRGGGAAP